MMQQLLYRMRIKSHLRDRRNMEQCLRWLGDRRSVCVLAPMFTPDNERDGYIRRVKTVDGTLLREYVRVYLMGDVTEARTIRFEYIDDTHAFVQFNSFDPAQRREIFRLVRRCGQTYIHSVYRFMAGQVSRKMTGLLALPGVEHTWDVHGAVPEECCMNGDPGIGAVAAEIEKSLYAASKTIVCVNRAMERHLREKYGETEADFRILPVMGLSESSDAALPDKPGGEPITVYAGGLQEWQCIPEMQDLMAETMERMHYKILVPDPEAFRKSWGSRPPMRNIAITSCAPEDMGKEYAPCSYGLLLREDSPVNRVACPTKLIEYIQNGIVPVLSFPEIGDFAEHGMQYVSAEDFRAGRLPEEEKRLDMAESNRKLLLLWEKADSFM